MAQLTMVEKIWLEIELARGEMYKQEMADTLGVSRQTIYDFIYKLQKYDDPIDKYVRKRTSGPAKLTLQNSNDLNDYVLDHPFAINKNIATDLELNVTEQTIGNYLRKLGFGTCVAAKKPFINLTNIRLRLAWAGEYMSWTLEDWMKIIFTDECTFQNYNEKHTVTFEAQSNIKRHFFGIMIYNQPIEIFECTDNMDAEEFDTLMTERIIPKITEKHLDEFTLQMENTSIHGDSISRLKSMGYKFLPWIAKSYDLSPFENVWGLVKRKKNQSVLNRTISNQLDFDELIRSICHEIPIDTINRLYESMPNRVVMLKKNCGKAIRN